MTIIILALLAVAVAALIRQTRRERLAKVSVDFAPRAEEFERHWCARCANSREEPEVCAVAACLECFPDEKAFEYVAPFDGEGNRRCGMFRKRGADPDPAEEESPCQ